MPQLRLETVRQAAIAQTLARPKPMKVVKPHRLYTPPKPASPCDCPRCRLAQICQDATAAISKATSNPPLDTSTTHLPDGDGCGDDLTALQSGLIPAYLWPYVRINDVMPYPQLKSNRGRKKQLSTAGFACPHLDCQYRGITDEAIHALVHYGQHGKREPIPDLMCQACNRKITSRTMTVLYRLRTPSAKVALILHTIVEGMSEEGTARTFSSPADQPNFHSDTIRRWITRAAKHSAALHAILFSNLSIPIVQLDERFMIATAMGSARNVPLRTQSNNVST